MTHLLALTLLEAGKRLYIQFYPWGDFRVKAGFLSNGRYEIQARTRKI